MVYEHLTIGDCNAIQGGAYAPRELRVEYRPDHSIMQVVLNVGKTVERNNGMRLNDEALAELRDWITAVLTPEPEPRFYQKTYSWYALVLDTENPKSENRFFGNDFAQRAREYMIYRNRQVEFEGQVVEAAANEVAWSSVNPSDHLAADPVLAEAHGAVVTTEVRDTTPSFFTANYGVTSSVHSGQDLDDPSRTWRATFGGDSHVADAENFKRVLIQRHFDANG